MLPTTSFFGVPITNHHHNAHSKDTTNNASNSTIGSYSTFAAELTTSQGTIQLPTILVSPMSDLCYKESKAEMDAQVALIAALIEKKDKHLRPLADKVYIEVVPKK